MKIESFIKTKENKYKLVLNNDEEIELYDDVIVKYSLLVNKDLDKNKLKELLDYNSNLDAYYKSLKLLSKKMMSKKELIKKLEKDDFNKEVILSVIERLYKESYLNDEVYVKAYINDQINLKLVGPNKIYKDLCNLGFEDNLINKHLEDINDSIWSDKINKYITKKIKSSSNLSAQKLKQKLAIDLVTKGFYKEEVLDIINNYTFITNSNVILKEYNKLKKKYENKYNDNELKYQIQNKLFLKGFTKEEINEVLDK